MTKYVQVANMDRRQFIKYVSLAGAGFSFTACHSTKLAPQKNTTLPVTSPVVAKEPLKVAFVYTGSVDDLGWTYAHDLGRREMEASLPGKVSSTFVENVSDRPDAERIIRQLALDGNKLIFATSFRYRSTTLKVAKDFPNIFFEQCSGYGHTANVGSYMGRFEEPRYLTGAIAGKMTKSNIIGFIGAYPLPEIIREISAFTQGLRTINPKAKVKVIWIQSWSNPAKETKAAQILVNLGADILAQHTNSTAVVQFAEEKGIFAFGCNTDMSQFGPKAHLTSVIGKWGKFYTDTALAVMNGLWKPKSVWYGIGQGMVDISPLNPIIPQDVQTLVMTKRDEFIKGIAHPFDGPVKDQKGVLRIPKGKVLKDKEQLAMNWYVEGIEVETMKVKS